VKSILRLTRVSDLPYLADKTTSRYVDLPLHPDEIDTIPELTAQPALKELVSVLNRKEGPFIVAPGIWTRQ